MKNDKDKKINLTKIRQIVNEEIKKIYENQNHEAIKDIVNSASKLLKAIDVFKATAPDMVAASCMLHIDNLEETLNDMISSPGSYVAKEKKIQKVTLRPVETMED